MNTELPAFEHAKVLIIGDLMIDRYWYGKTGRISPEAPVPVVGVNNIEDRPGGAGNVALNIAQFGATVTLLGFTGHDENAQTLHSQLTEKGIHCHFIGIDDYPTITKLRVISHQQQLIRLDFEEPIHQPEANSKLLSAFIDALNNADVDVVVLSDYAKGTLGDAPALIAEARRRQIPVLVDPKGHAFEKYQGATLLTPNLSEFEAVVGKCNEEKDIVTEGKRLMRDLQCEALLITRGEHGMTLIQSDTAPQHLPARAKEVFDVTGAGDTVIGTLAASLAAGASLPQATTLANLAASIVVSKLGTATATLDELQQALQPIYESRRGVVSEDAMVELVRAHQAKQETIVFTNGCFDILHTGHVTYLEQAKRLGDRLIVAVNSDASVSALKGPQRPINSVENRMTVLAALESVDWVIPFNEDTPARIIERTLPDVLVKGGDYTVEQIVGAQTVIDNGGSVKVLPFVDGCSTTQIIVQIQSDG